MWVNRIKNLIKIHLKRFIYEFLGYQNKSNSVHDLRIIGGDCAQGRTVRCATGRNFDPPPQWRRHVPGSLPHRTRLIVHGKGMLLQEHPASLAFSDEGVQPGLLLHAGSANYSAKNVINNKNKTRYKIIKKLSNFILRNYHIH